VEVNGEPILERALRALAAHDIREAVIVVGHKSEVIRARLGNRFEGIEIRYVDAPLYASTNNIHSLWDARDFFDQDILLLEADVVFDKEVIGAILRQPGSAAAVAPHHRALSGTVVRCDGQGRIGSFVLGADQDASFDSAGAFKTVNIYLLRAALLRTHLLPRLTQRIDGGHVHDYYESIFRDFVADGSVTNLAAVNVDASRWYEIDDHRDLDVAAFIFLDHDAQFDRIQELHGSYWRYGFVDHSYLYNMHFPPPAMLADLRDDLREIITNYPVGQTELARLVADWTGNSADHLVVANGGAELIKVLGNAFLGDLAIPTPSFNEYEEVVDSQRLHRMPLTQPDFDLDTGAFVDFTIACGANTAIIVSPNNPTARSVPRNEILEAAQRLGEHGCRLIVDESFIEFSSDGEAQSIESMVESYPNLAVLKSMSKVFGIAGLRIGYLLSADQEFVDAVRASLPIWNINGPAEAFLRAIGRYRREFAESCSLTRTACLDLYERLRALPGLEPIEPDANFVLCKLADASNGGPSIGAVELTRHLYVNHNILIKDCAGKSMPQADRYVRIASRTPTENNHLVQALQRTLLNTQDLVPAEPVQEERHRAQRR
jgi:histidinol-phosphate/aromatic aminotransferase/cobyric acid decarboxylase-like protein